MGLFLQSCAGLSLSFEAGVTLKISPVTCKYMAKGYFKGRPKGPEPLEGSGGMLHQKML